eukprot:6819141-Heterocapsa_arctica.AAC.1
MEAVNQFHGPKTGVRGARNFEHRDEGGWECSRCSKFTTTRLAWRRPVRGHCVVRAKASRVNWKKSSHRRKWLSRVAKKEAA